MSTAYHNQVLRILKTDGAVCRAVIGRCSGAPRTGFLRSHFDSTACVPDSKKSLNALLYQSISSGVLLVEPTTLKIERLLPGPIDRVWAYLTQSDLRRRWLASGEMRLAPDAPFELVWRNDELSDPPGHRPEGFSEEDRMASRIITVIPPHRLVFSWGEGGEVSIELQALGKDVLLTLVHRRLANRKTRLEVGAGWHAHLDILAARLQEKEPKPFWDSWLGLKEEYEHRIP